MKPKVLLDPHPRTLELLFAPEDLKRLKSLVRPTVWEGSRMPADMVETILPEAFAAVREASKRTLGQRHYDVQLRWSHLASRFDF